MFKALQRLLRLTPPSITMSNTTYDSNNNNNLSNNQRSDSDNNINALSNQLNQTHISNNVNKSTTTVVDDIAQLIQRNHAKNIIVMTGAGISTSCGIPDFR